MWKSVLQNDRVHFFLLHVRELEMMNIYVGNLSYETTSNDLETVFAEFGEVTRATVVSDRETGQSKGFGFVEMSNEDDAQSAIGALNEKELNGRSVKVNVARPREERPRRW